MNNFDHDGKSPIPKLAVFGMIIMGIGIGLILFTPTVGVSVALIGLILSLIPQRP